MSLLSSGSIEQPGRLPRSRERRYRKYSPAIAEHLISPLYHLARARRVPMTVLVSRIVEEYLQSQTTSEEPRAA